MKKFLIILLVCFLLVGCVPDKNESNESTKNETVKPVKNESVLICSKKATASSIDFITEMSYLFEGDKLEKLGVRYTYDLSPYTDEQMEIFKTFKPRKQFSQRRPFSRKGQGQKRDRKPRK